MFVRRPVKDMARSPNMRKNRRYVSEMLRAGHQ
jgi:hypothetical protein